jgi:hypothetical protein
MLSAAAFRSGMFKPFKSFNTFKLFNEPIFLGRLERFERLELLEPYLRGDTEFSR